MTRPPHDYRGYKAGQRFRFLNVLEELDEPGEWYLDRASGVLYFWPPEPIAQARVFVSLLKTPLVTLRDCEHVTLRGLILECTRGSGVEILGGRHNLVAGCTLRNVGTVGVAIGGVVPDLERRIYNDTTFAGNPGTDNGVLSCHIHDTGECGIILGGGDRKTLQPGRNYAINNDIHHFGRWVRTYRPAVFLYGVGNRVAHNRLHDAPHTAVFFWGNDHVLEFNEVYRVCTETGDAGAFYLGRDWTQRGSVIRHNHFHDLAATLHGQSGFNAVMAVYLDDMACGTTVFGNVVRRVDIGILIGGGRDHRIENNLFVDCPLAISMDHRGYYGSADLLLARLKAVGFDRPPYSTRYPALARILDGNPELPAGNVIARNISFRSTFLSLSGGRMPEEIRKLVAVTDNLTEGGPGLVAPETGDFRLREDSPAWKLGFQPIPFDKIGRYPDDYRE
ncbi:MAG: right-handed parallel beta-helix repeat-containing protein [Thermoguttaceae bacterium]|nr:right-handed parallel beta-helix repeat-containing protein [Thermoguttaceae bacterium]